MTFWSINQTSRDTRKNKFGFSIQKIPLCAPTFVLVGFMYVCNRSWICHIRALIERLVGD